MRTALAAFAAVVVAGCSAGSAGPTPSVTEGSVTGGSASAPAVGGSSWPTYHGDNRRTGVGTSPALRPPLRVAWRQRLDGAVYAEPLVVNGLVVVATENDSVYALSPADGRVVWRRHLGTPVPASDLPCGNIDPSGITGTPAYDDAAGSVFVVTETTGARHTLHALDVRSGQPRWERSLDVLPSRDPRAEQERAALLVAGGRVYAAFGGRYGDCGNYVGYVTATATDGSGDVLHYAVPTAREAGMWAPPGPVLAPATSGAGVLVASGNGAETGGRYDGSDSVIKLSPTLRQLTLFAPSTWPQDNAEDLDLGSTAPVVTSNGDVVIAGKRGTVYLLPPSLGGVGGDVGTLTGCAAYGGGALVRNRIVLLPCNDGVRRLDLTGSSMRWAWQLAGISGSPTVSAGTVYTLDTDRGSLVLAALASGRVQARIDVGDVSRFATPTPVGSHVYVGTLDGVVAVAGG